MEGVGRGLLVVRSLEASVSNHLFLPLNVFVFDDHQRYHADLTSLQNLFICMLFSKKNFCYSKYPETPTAFALKI